MKLRGSIRNLIGASALALAVAGVAGGLSATPADAKDNVKMCSFSGSDMGVGHPDLDFVFYLPGEKVTIWMSSEYRQVATCTASGKWNFKTERVPRGKR